MAYPSLLFLVYCLAPPPRSYADNSSVDNLTFTLPVSCTLSGSGTDSHSDSLLNGIYKSDIGKSTLSTFCNDNNGYVVYAIGSSNNEEGNNVLVSSVSTSHTAGDPDNYDIITGTATSGNTSNWAMKLAYVDNDTSPTPPSLETGFLNYSNVPSSWTKVASIGSNTTNMDKGSSFTTTYAVYTSPTQPVATYTGQVKYAMLHPSSSTKPITLSEAYKNAGKTKVYTEDPITGDSGYFYTMQDMSSSICNAVNVYGEASQTQLVDTRDGKLYWATKLHTDKYNGNIGQCWMTENLDLDLIADTTAENYVALTSENTDLNLYGSMGYTSTNGYSCSNEATTTNCTANGEIITWIPERTTIPPTGLNSTSWTNDSANPYSYDRGAVEPNDHKDGYGYAGNYYNWTAAIASNASGYSGGGNAANSICPKGWRLPNAKAGEGGYEFSKLLYAYNVITNDTDDTSYTTNGYKK